LLSERHSTDALCLVTQYNNWIAHIINWIANSYDKTYISSDQRKQSIKLAIYSSVNFRLSVKDLNKPSPLTDLFLYQTLSNELQIQCAGARFDAAQRELLIETVATEHFFEKASRFMSICENWRVYEALHALTVANVVRDRYQVERFGLLALRAMDKNLSIALGARAPDDHPVFTFTQPLFAGDPSPSEVGER
jgi:hypothetical protein